MQYYQYLTSLRLSRFLAEDSGYDDTIYLEVDYYHYLTSLRLARRYQY